MLWVQFCAIHSVTVKGCLTSALPCNTLNDQLYSFHIWWGCCFFWCYSSRWQTPSSMVPFPSAAWLYLQHLYARLNEMKCLLLTLFSFFFFLQWISFCVRFSNKKVFLYRVCALVGMCGWMCSWEENDSSTSDISCMVENMPYCNEIQHQYNFPWLRERKCVWQRKTDELCEWMSEKGRLWRRQQ